MVMVVDGLDYTHLVGVEMAMMIIEVRALERD